MSRGGSGSSSRGGRVQKGKINILEEWRKREGGKVGLGVVVVGHVDAGKSTLVGQLLYRLGKVDERQMKKFEREAEKIGKGSFAYAWVMDETDEERNRGVTIDVGVRWFETPHRKFTVLDAPGHRDFVPRVVGGASQADVAILVIDSTPGEFETGFQNGGQTREHAVLIRSLGVSQVVVAVNKLDLCGWSEGRFQGIVEKLGGFLMQAGFKKDKVTFVPTSGFTGENLLKRQSDELKRWYSGKTLVEVLDAFEAPQRPVEKPFRLSVTDLFKGSSAGGGGGGATG
ncbi:HBS1-like protein, partial [Rhizophlyctis rosea]